MAVITVETATIAAIQAAINGASGPTVIYLPDALVAAESPLVIDRSGITLRASGPLSGLTGDADRLIEINGEADLSDVAVDGLRLVGDLANTVQKGIWTSGVTDCRFVNCTISDMGDSGIMCADGSTFQRVLMAGNVITGCGNFGIVANSTSNPGGSADLIIEGNRCEDFTSELYPAHGIYLRGTSRATVNGNVCKGATGHGSASNIYIGAGSNLVSVSANVCDGGHHGIIVDADQVVVTGNAVSGVTTANGISVFGPANDVVVSGNIIDASGEGNRGVVVQDAGGGTPSGVLVVGNSITAGGSGAILCYLAEHVHVLNNICRLAGNSTAYMIDLYGSTAIRVGGNLVSGGNRSVMVRNTCADVTIEGNAIMGASVFGIRVDHGGSGLVRVVDNDVSGHSGTAGSVGSSPTSTGVTFRDLAT